ncbi:hypothetical protein AKJ56_00335 [candidate division MSBL1 archaeon SCGC-AAA382N08]|uniref:Uncharacterized protein n=1 Tax=candidate division MSBL1 archaeon SCGC-AAA382N08 TaxID=1698285 RepID=A0A133VQP4_9EURY|nr:hypothetical protein AKJ56_00335 [candidate division MSBL1 archaeon SCGC-AAA382N08]
MGEKVNEKDEKPRDREGIPLKCKNCGYKWIYKGNSKFYASCPRCNYKVNIEKRKISWKELEEEDTDA